LPLAEKKKLGETVESVRISVLFLCPSQCGRLVFFEFLRPFGPGFFLENFTLCGKQSKILEPLRMVLPKFLEILL
jgi:hypothetical protein